MLRIVRRAVGVAALFSLGLALSVPAYGAVTSDVDGSSGGDTTYVTGGTLNRYSTDKDRYNACKADGRCMDAISGCFQSGYYRATVTWEGTKWTVRCDDYHG